jgi:tetrapyrrole methylase family protein/MazG family protein/ATP diphosphatase
MTESALERLLGVMRKLRDPQGGCPWDLEQDWRSLAPFTLEEAYEVVELLERDQLDALKDELGDLLFQVVFLSQLAAEEGRFTFQDVAAAIADKLTRRHPHVFGDASAEGDLNQRWDALKASERQARGQHGILDDVPLALPALNRAMKLGKRAARVGFDWPDAQGARTKVLEELAEFDAAIASGSAAQMQDELGDLLLALSSWSRHLQLDPETALRQANRKLEVRFAHMEQMAAQQGETLGSLTAQRWDELWLQAKQAVVATEGAS